MIEVTALSSSCAAAGTALNSTCRCALLTRFFSAAQPAFISLSASINASFAFARLARLSPLLSELGS